MQALILARGKDTSDTSDTCAKDVSNIAAGEPRRLLPQELSPWHISKATGHQRLRYLRTHRGCTAKLKSHQTMDRALNEATILRHLIVL